MRVIYLSKRARHTSAAYLAALIVLVAGAGLFLPTDSGDAAVSAEAPAPAVVPYRCGADDVSNVSLAFNVDWGEEYLPSMLEVLAQYDVTATFFLTGRWCGEHAELAKSIAEAGHELGNHGYSHASPNASSAEQIVEEISRTEQAIEQATGVTTRLYAPPSGEEEQHVLDAAASVGYRTILWSVDTIDWQKPAPETIVQRVTDKAHNGAIILAHPTEMTLAALPTIIEQLQTEGYSFVTVSRNLAL